MKKIWQKLPAIVRGIVIVALCLALFIAIRAYPSRSERIIEFSVYLMNLESDSEDPSKYENGVFTLVEKIEAISEGESLTLSEEDERSFLRQIHDIAGYVYIEDLAGDLSKKDGYPGTMFVIHVADGNKIEVSVWDQYFIVNGTAYEADEKLCETIAAFHPEFTTVTVTDIEAIIIPTVDEVRANGYPTNENGETYGPVLWESTEHPDLELAIADDGREGYVRNSEFDDGVTTPEEAANYKPGKRVVNVYLHDGVTVIGTFTLGGD